MNPPGAPMSGFNVRSGDKPYELKDEINPPVAFGNDTDWLVHVIVTGPPAMRPLIAAPAVLLMLTTGMVIGGLPATVGLTMPATLLYSTTPAAPACCALVAFTKKPHVPRRMST